MVGQSRHRAPPRLPRRFDAERRARNRSPGSRHSHPRPLRPRKHRQGLPKEPLAEFVSLAVAGQPAEPQFIERRRANNILEDAYHLYNWPDAPPGRHTATVTLRRPNSETLLRRSITFTV